MPSFSSRTLGKPIAECSAAELIGIFVILPILLGGGILALVVRNAILNAANFTGADWFWQVGWAGLLSLAVATALPAVAIQEFRRRRQARRDNRAEKS